MAHDLMFINCDDVCNLTLRVSNGWPMITCVKPFYVWDGTCNNTSKILIE